MKILLASLLLTISLTTYAGRDCKINGYVIAPARPDMTVRSTFLTNGNFTTQTETWEECYKFTIEKYKTFYESMEVTYQEKSYTTYLYFDWRFSIGFMSWPTKGSITRNTDKFELYLAEGNRRYLSNGLDLY